MKKLTFLFVAFLFGWAQAQAPSNYYDGTAGLNGAALKTKLSQIITAGHKDNGYDGLYTGYNTTDRDYFFENDGTVLDMYSENPTGKDPYNYSPGQKKCGNYNSEGDCYNREHVVPQSFFNSKAPMVSDIHFIRPTDGKVNGMRSNYPFGMVSNPTWTSKNGSKLGSNSTTGYGGTVFEPIDTFKGDIARMVFYFVTRYESQIPSFNEGNMLAKNTYPSLQDWELKTLLKWSAQDPVSAEEIARNNASYNFQGNRNPYIDHPEWVQTVWGVTSTDTEAPSAPTNLTAGSATFSTVALSWNASTDNTAVSYYSIYVNGIFKTNVTATSATITGLTSGTAYDFYVKAYDAAGNASAPSNTAQATTLTDTQNPTAPTNVAVTNTTSNSVSLNWTASTDNGTIAGYDIYVNGVLNTTVTSTKATIVNLNPSTTYSFYVIAKDAANNASVQSNTVQGTTLAPSTNTSCGNEDFETMPKNASSYEVRTWTNNGITWTATDARTDQTINNRAITIRDGSLTGTAAPNGIGSLTVTTMLKFSGSAGTLNVLVNGTKVGTVPYGTSETTTTLSDINIGGNVVISLVNQSSTNRVAIDDLSWTCYTPLATSEHPSSGKKFTVFPNPVRNSEVTFNDLDKNTTTVQIYNMNGQLVQELTNVKNGVRTPLRKLAKGIYIVKAGLQTAKIIIE